MRKTFILSITAAMAIGTAAWITGCASTSGKTAHQVVSQAADHKIQCQKCYDEVIRIRRSFDKGKHRWKKTHMITRHVCPDCKTELSIYTEDGKPMVKCAKCAPEGVACDRCLPPQPGA